MADIEFRKQYQKEWKKNNPEKVKAASARYWIKNKEEVKLRAYPRRRAYTKKLKQTVIYHYSDGKMVCMCCGESTFEFLSIDDIDGKFHKHLGLGSAFYIWLIRNAFPKGFQVLCMNCNHAKGIYGKCPHQLQREANVIQR
jgi:hypothetical protein